MHNPGSTKPLSNRIDMNGMEHLFIDAESSVTGDPSQKTTVDVPIRRAAQILGISERTVWRKIEKGELKSKTKGNKRLVRVPVFVPTPAGDSDGHMTLQDTPSNANAVVNLTLLLKELQAAHYRIGYLEGKNQDYEKQVKLLPDLQAQVVKAELLEAELKKVKSTWWFRFCSWFLGS